MRIDTFWYTDGFRGGLVGQLGERFSLAGEDDHGAEFSQGVSKLWLTIITVVKDDQPGLMATAKSIAEQGLDGVQWVLIDGSSNPIEYEWPENLKAILSYFWVPPRGIYQAMNVGLSKARAPHLLYLNAGDILVGGDVVQSLRPWCQAVHEGWLYGRVELIDAKDRKRLASGFNFSEEERHRFRRGRFPQQPATVYATTELRSVGGFDDRFTIAADYLAMLVLSKRQHPQFVGVTITRFKLDGISSQDWRLSLAQAFKARCEVYGLDGVSRQFEWWLSRSVWMRSWLYRVLLKVSRQKMFRQSVRDDFSARSVAEGRVPS